MSVNDDQAWREPLILTQPFLGHPVSCQHVDVAYTEGRPPNSKITSTHDGDYDDEFVGDELLDGILCPILI